MSPENADRARRATVGARARQSEAISGQIGSARWFGSREEALQAAGLYE